MGSLPRLPTPRPDGVGQHWWNGTRDEQLLLQSCTACGAVQFYPRTLCTSCKATRLKWIEASGYGSIHSFTTVHRRAYAELEVPYTILLVDLDEGPRMLSRLVRGPYDIRIGLRVVATWVDVPGESNFRLPIFGPVDG